MVVDNECKIKFLEVKSKRNHRFITFNIDEKLQQITLDKIENPGQTYDEFIDSLPKECKYVFYDFDFVTEKNCQKRKIFFIAW